MDHVFDVAIIGGGINGCGCAADAALRGLSVVLLEKDDLASKTSSSSTKLIHGGLRYLENFEFNLVRKALNERQTLLDMAPHLVHPQAIVLPLHHQKRPLWLVRFGLFIYDHLSRYNQLPKCKSLNRKKSSVYFKPLNNEFNHAFLYYDASTDDARLTITNALQAKNHGASIRTQSTIIEAKTCGQQWLLTIQPKNGPIYTIRAKSLINAAGPWVASVAKLTATPAQRTVTLVKGSHIVVPKIYEGSHAYFLQHHDERMIFVIPYHGYTMIGTTEIKCEQYDNLQISDEEVSYLIDLVNTHFKTKIQAADILHSWSGIRPLIANEEKDIHSLSRDYHTEYLSKPAPIVIVYGGKITTYRQMAEEVINQLAPLFPNINGSKTKVTPLPGAAYYGMNFQNYIQYAKEKYSWLGDALLHRYLYTYGSNMELFLCRCTGIDSMGKHFGGSLYQIEVDYLILEEWASHSEDILYRRTKLCLEIDAKAQQELANYLSLACSIKPNKKKGILQTS